VQMWHYYQRCVAPVAPEEHHGAFSLTGTIKCVTLDLSGELIGGCRSRYEDRYGWQ
jgi:hypothetical protein